MSACSSGSSSSARSRNGGGRTRWWPGVALVASLLAGASTFVPRSASATAPARTSVMKELASATHALEGALDTGDLAAANAASRELVRHLPGLRDLSPAPTDPAAGSFDALFARLDTVSGELTRRTAAGDPVASAAAFAELRTTCVACHVRFREDDVERGSFPGRDNTLTGTVRLLDADGDAVEDRSWVLVFLEGAPGVERSPRYQPAVISQSGRRFDPRVLPVQVGTEVHFPNDDTIFHNVFSLSRTAPFDLGVYEAGQSASVHMKRSGLVKVYCNIHPDMSASIVVLENPWYALCDADGRFVLCDVPDGTYRLRAWNDRGAEAGQDLELRGGRLQRVQLELQETHRVLTHTNKFGKPYSGKYQ
jgi:plastocyanin